MIWIIVGYMWLFLHRPFEVWPILGTIRLERVYMIATLIAWLTIAEKQLTENKMNFAVAMMAFAMFLATLMSEYTNIFDSSAMQNWFKLVVFYVLVMTSVKREKDLKILVTGFLVCFFLYLVHSYWEFLHGRYNYAMGTVRMIGVDETMSNPNGFGASIVMHIPLLLPFMVLAKKRWHYLFMIAYFLLSARCVQLTGSRSSFVGLGVLLVTAALVSKRRLLLIPLMCLACVVAWFSLTENLKERYMTLIDPTINESATESAQGRSKGFWDGVHNWESSPIYGVGPDMHGKACGSGFLSHQLYAQVIGELGTIGAVAYLLLVFFFFTNHWEIMQEYSDLKRQGREAEGLYCYRVSLMTVTGLLVMLYFGFSGHNAYRYNWVWFAAIQATALAMMKEKTVRHHPDLLPPSG